MYPDFGLGGTVRPVPLPRLIASDLDGTLLGPDGQVSEQTRAALSRASAAGIEILVATGRSRYTAVPKLEAIEEIRWVVCSNGAMIWDRHTESVVMHRPITGTVAIHVVDHLRRHVPDVAIGWETPGGFGFDHRFHAQPPSIEEFRLHTEHPEPDPDTEVTKLLVTIPGADGPEALYEAIGPHVPGSVIATSSGGGFLETTAAGVDKGSTLAAFASGLDIDADEVMTFGDQHNDMAMLEWAGTGVGMGNGHPAVLDVADLQAPSNADHGVAQVINALLD